jgi:LuxR family maltose regulon positive regulatory protein
LQVTETISEPVLHRLASQWFDLEGLFPEAIQHALEGMDWERAAHLIEDHSVSMLSHGEMTTLLGWFKAFPEVVIRKHPQICRDCGWAQTLTGQLEAAAAYLDCAERALQGDDEQLGQVLVGQAYLARARGEYPKAISLSKQALALVREKDVLHRSLVTFTLGFSHLGAGHLAEAEQALLEASSFRVLREMTMPD